VRWKYLSCLWIICFTSVQGRSIDKNPVNLDLLSIVKSLSNLHEPHVSVLSIHESVQGETDVFRIRGKGFHREFHLGIIKSSLAKGTECPEEQVVDIGTPFQRILQSNAPDEALLASPDFIQPDHDYFFCTKSKDSGTWIHQGVSLVHANQIKKGYR